MTVIAKPHGDFEALTVAEAAKVNDQINTLFNDHNGGISDPNIHALANINQGKILNLAADLNTIRAQKVQEINIVYFGASATYTKPGDLLFAHVIVLGGGGGGGGAQSSGVGAVASGGGGGSGGYTEAWLPNAFVQAAGFVTVGLGGAGGLGATPSNGSAGGVTSFPTVGGALVANGGGGGGGTVDLIGVAGPGGASSGIVPPLLLGFPGGNGGVGFITTAPGSIALGGAGGAVGPYQRGGLVSATGTVVGGFVGSFGGGGSGAASAGANSADGGAGGTGAVIIFEFKA